MAEVRYEMLVDGHSQLMTLQNAASALRSTAFAVEFGEVVCTRNGGFRPLSDDDKVLIEATKITLMGK